MFGFKMPNTIKVNASTPLRAGCQRPHIPRNQAGRARGVVNTQAGGVYRPPAGGGRAVNRLATVLAGGTTVNLGTGLCRESTVLCGPETACTKLCTVCGVLNDSHPLPRLGRPRSFTAKRRQAGRSMRRPSGGGARAILSGAPQPLRLLPPLTSLVGLRPPRQHPSPSQSPPRCATPPTLNTTAIVEAPCTQRAAHAPRAC